MPFQFQSFANILGSQPLSGGASVADIAGGLGSFGPSPAPAAPTGAAPGLNLMSGFRGIEGNANAYLAQPQRPLPKPAAPQSFGAKVKGFLGKDSTIRLMATLGAALSPEGSPMERLGKAVAAQKAMQGYTKYLNSLSKSIMAGFEYDPESDLAKPPGEVATEPSELGDMGDLGDTLKINMGFGNQTSSAAGVAGQNRMMST